MSTDFINAVKSNIIYKQTNVIASLDYDDTEHIINTIELLGNHILGIKLHSDIVKNFDQNYINTLKLLKRTYNLIIIEDRKFCDIGSIVKKQSSLITEYADLITCHALPGQGIIDGLRENCLKNNCRILLIAQMSSQNNLIDDNYIKSVTKLAENNSDVVSGLISQKSLSTNMLHFAPGVNLSKSSDDLQQGYNTPEYLINSGIDILIVGRGITDELHKYCTTNVQQLIKLYTCLNIHNLHKYYSQSLIKNLEDNGIIITSEEEFTLSSGIKSNTYYNIKNLICYPKIMYDVSLFVKLIIDKICVDKFGTKNITECNLSIAGVPQGGISIASCVSLVLNIPSILVRKEQKSYGLNNQIDGDYINKNIIIIEDVITTGNSVRDFIKLIKTIVSNNTECFVNIVAVISICNRGNIDVLKTEYGDINVYSVINVDSSE